MSNTTRDFLIKLGEDPDLRARFDQDPRAVMNENSVPDAHQSLILSGDKEALKKEAGIQDQHANFIIV